MNVAVSVDNIGLFYMLFAMWIIYRPLSLIALARAVSLYKGKAVWSVLTKIMIVLGWVSYIFFILNIII